MLFRAILSATKFCTSYSAVTKLPVRCYAIQSKEEFPNIVVPRSLVESAIAKGYMERLAICVSYANQSKVVVEDAKFDYPAIARQLTHCINSFGAKEADVVLGIFHGPDEDCILTEYGGRITAKHLDDIKKIYTKSPKDALPVHFGKLKVDMLVDILWFESENAVRRFAEIVPELEMHANDDVPLCKVEDFFKEGE